MLLADLASTEVDPPPEIKTAVITHCPTIIHSLTHKVAPHGCPLYLPQPINNTAFKGKILLYEALGINQILSSFPNNINNTPIINISVIQINVFFIYGSAHLYLGVQLCGSVLGKMPNMLLLPILKGLG